MSDETPPRRLSQIFDPLTSLSDLEQIQQQIQQHQQHLLQHQQQQQQQQSHHKYGVVHGGPSNSSSTSTLLQHHMSSSGAYNSSYNTASSSTSLSSASNQSAKMSSSSSTSSYVGGPPPGLNRIVMGSRSTPNSPRLMARRGGGGGGGSSGGAGGSGGSRPPMIPPRVAPNASMIANPSLAALDSDAPWPAFSSLTDNLDVHQVNNYNQGLPEINWQERCLELQLELHRSRNQAGRVRDMLREKPTGDPYAFTLTTDVTMAAAGTLGTAAAGVTGAACTTDYLIIPNVAGATTDRYCGAGLGTVTSNSLPFTLWYITDANEAADVANRGFHLIYTQNLCPIPAVGG